MYLFFQKISNQGSYLIFGVNSQCTILWRQDLLPIVLWIEIFIGQFCFEENLEIQIYLCSQIVHVPSLELQGKYDKPGVDLNTGQEENISPNEVQVLHCRSCQAKTVDPINPFLLFTHENLSLGWENVCVNLLLQSIRLKSM